MPQGYLKFQLPEEEEEFWIAQRGSAYLSILQDLDNQLRQIVKHGEDAQRAEFAAEVREWLVEFQQERNIYIWD